MATPRRETFGSMVDAAAKDYYARHRAAVNIIVASFVVGMILGHRWGLAFGGSIILAVLITPLSYVLRREVARAWWDRGYRKLLASDSLRYPGRKEARDFHKTDLARRAEFTKMYYPACEAYGLVNKLKQAAPPRKVRTLSNGDITFDAHPGKTAVKDGVKGYIANADGIATICGATHGMRVKPLGARGVRCTLLWTERLGQKIQIQDLKESPADRISYGEDEDGNVLSIWMALSVLIIGLTGSGKSGILWALITDLMRKVNFWLYVIDPKGGQELGMFKPLVKRPRRRGIVKDWAGNTESASRIINTVWTELKSRQEQLIGVRKWSAALSAEYPLIVMPIDEALELMMNISKDDLAKLMTIISQGRAAGVMCIMLCQLPQKAILDQVRGIIAQKLALQTEGPIDTGLIFGDASAEAKGAKCSEIRTPGVGYARIDGVVGYQMFRAAYVDDDDIARIVSDELPEGMGGIGKTEKIELYLIYLYRTSDTQGLYVGITNDLDRRDKEHRAKYEKGDPMHYWYPFHDPTMTLIYTAESFTAAKAKESELIRKWKPPGNTAENAGNPMQGRPIEVEHPTRFAMFHRKPAEPSTQVWAPPHSDDIEGEVVDEPRTPRGPLAIEAPKARPRKTTARPQNRKRWSVRDKPTADAETVEPTRVLDPVQNWHGSE